MPPRNTYRIGLLVLKLNIGAKYMNYIYSFNKKNLVFSYINGDYILNGYYTL